MSTGGLTFGGLTFGGINNLKRSLIRLSREASKKASAIEKGRCYDMRYDFLSAVINPLLQCRRSVQNYHRSTSYIASGCKRWQGCMSGWPF